MQNVIATGHDNVKKTTAQSRRQTSEHIIITATTRYTQIKAQKQESSWFVKSYDQIFEEKAIFEVKKWAKASHQQKQEVGDQD